MTASHSRRGDVVVVTLNYRLGVLGWVTLDHLDPDLAGAGNNGVRDQIEALRWVQANIAAFGGDPANVTIFGESAGGGSVAAVLAAPEADGLYTKAIIESGPAGFGPASNPAGYVDEILQAMGEAGGGIDALRAADPLRLVDAVTAVGIIERLGRDADHGIDGGGMGPRPSVDGLVVTRTVVDAVTEKGAHGIPLLIGTNRDEGTLFTILLPNDMTDDAIAATLPESIADRAGLVAGYRARSTGRPLLVDFMTDGVFRIPSLRVADAQAAAGAPVWVYLFTWRTPVFGGLLGATHALEIPFVWDMLLDPTWKFLVGSDPPLSLATAMQDGWLAFARTGNPNAAGVPDWPQYDATTRPTMEFGDEVRVVDDPDSEIREAWYSRS